LWAACDDAVRISRAGGGGAGGAVLGRRFEAEDPSDVADDVRLGRSGSDAAGWSSGMEPGADVAPDSLFSATASVLASLRLK